MPLTLHGTDRPTDDFRVQLNLLLLPVVGLNVYSMLKHETLVLTLPALEKIEEKILSQMHNPDHREKKFSRFSTWTHDETGAANVVVFQLETVHSVY